MNLVFFNNQPIYLTTDLKRGHHVHFYHFDKLDLMPIIKKMELEEIDKLYLYKNDAKVLQQDFSNQFKIIEAAGGKVFNNKNEVLFIYRNDKWDLPKGKIEKDETMEKAAVREVEEETGIDRLKIINPLETTYHIYKCKEEYVLKVTYWFAMETDFNGQLLPQQEEGITKVEWLSNDEIKNALENTYANIKLLF